jgi:hypothetical protein
LHFYWGTGTNVTGAFTPTIDRPTVTKLANLDLGGGFGYAMSSHFLHRPRLAEVLIDAKGDRVIRQPTKETGFLAESGLSGSII